MMTKKFIYNISNHSSETWSEEQKKAAIEKAQYLTESNNIEIIDIPFPNIYPEMGTVDVADLAYEYTGKVRDMDIAFIVINGEMTFVYSFIAQLRADGCNIPCYTATTKRDSIETKNEDGSVTKTSVFKFVKFREYYEFNH